MLLRSTLRALDELATKLRRTPERAPHLVSGACGEDEAYFHLRKLGFTVIARDYRSPRRRGDIDLIAWEKETLCFVEVKTRAYDDPTPEDQINPDKQQQVIRAAKFYLARYGVPQPPARFDVISVYLESNGSDEITLFRDAFHMS